MFVRVEVRAALKAAIETSLGDDQVQVVDGFDAPNHFDERIEIGLPMGGVEYVVFQAATKPRDDQFMVPVFIFAGKSGQSILDATGRVQELMNVVDDALYDATFNELEVHGSRTEAYVFSALLGETIGPASEPSDSGHVGFAQVNVNVHTRSNFTGP